jgi:hypothetical protein
MARNPRPCVCGHPGAEHGHQEASGPCWWGWPPDTKGCDCPAYRPARRTEPLRALAGRPTTQVPISADTSDFEAAMERVREVFAMDADAIHRLVRLSDAVKERR